MTILKITPLNHIIYMYVLDGETAGTIYNTLNKLYLRNYSSFLTKVSMTFGI